MHKLYILYSSYISVEKDGLVRDLKPGPLAPEARIIPIDQRANIAVS